MGRVTLKSRGGVALVLGAVLLIVSGCGAAAITGAPSSAALAAARKACRAVVWPSSPGTATAPPLGPPGSCPAEDVQRVMDLVARLRDAVRGNGKVCPLLTPNYRSNAQRWQGEPPGYPSCDAAVLKVGGAVNPKLQFAQPVARILLFYRNGRAGGLITFSKATATSLPADPRTQPITISTTRTSDGTWQIEQIGYQF
jgi:hypothetical protein